MDQTKINDISKNAYEKYHKRLIAEMYLHTHDYDFAEDCVHDAFCVLHNKLKHEGNEIKDMHAWILSIAKNCAMRYTNRRLIESYIEDVPETLDAFFTEPIEYELEKMENSELLIKSINLLSPLNRRLVVLHYLNGLSLYETGLKTGMSGEAVRKAISRCKKQLKDEVKLCS